MTIKERYKRFKEWQKEPFQYELHSNEVQHCANCHHDFTGNFCPYCSQKVGLGRITWKSVGQGILLVFGMDTRSLSYTILQLFLRPGYLISDYLNGKRQVSFPPVKMLLIVAMVYVLLNAVFHIKGTSTVSNDEFVMVKKFYIWFYSNPGWGMMVISGFLILSTWLFFRYAPRNTKHTLPEGFYIQVFLSTLVLIITSFSGIIGGVASSLVLMYYFITYHQLFGYGWWGTIWRTFLTLGESFMLILLVAVTVEFLMGNLRLTAKETAGDVLLSLGIVFVINAAIVTVFFFISRYSSKRRAKRIANREAEESAYRTLE